MVGGVTNEGKLWDRSQVADFVKVHAPSFEVNCADGKGGLRNHREVTGTSVGMCLCLSCSPALFFDSTFINVLQQQLPQVLLD